MATDADIAATSLRARSVAGRAVKHAIALMPLLHRLRCDGCSGRVVPSFSLQRGFITGKGAINGIYVTRVVEHFHRLGSTAPSSQWVKLSEIAVLNTPTLRILESDRSGTVVITHHSVYEYEVL